MRSLKSGLSAWSVGIRDTFDVEKQSDSAQDPSLWWGLGLQLCSEHVGGSTSLGLVHWALVQTVVDLAFWSKRSSSAADHGYNTEWLLWSALLQLSGSRLPSGTLDLEAEHVGALSLLAWRKICLPVQFLEDISLDCE